MYITAAKNAMNAETMSAKNVNANIVKNKNENI